MIFHSRQLLKSQSKYYGVDMGIRNILLPDHQEDFGHIIENISYLDAIKQFTLERAVNTRLILSGLAI